MKRASIFKRDIPVGSRKPTASPGIAQEVQGGVGDVFAVKDGDLFAWTYRGDPHYRLRPAGTGPAVLSEVLARRFPSRLLAARYEVVDLVGRSEELENLRDWAWKPAGTAVRVVYGMGGQGKTRLVARFAHDLSQVGWAVVEAHNRLAPLLGGATTAVDTAQSLDGAGLLIIVDYADRWPTPDLLAILDAHIGLPGPVRVLLVGRGLQGWWKSVEGALLDAGIDEVDEFRLSPLSDGLDREGLDVQRAFRSAVAAFSPYLGLTESSLVSVPDYAPTPGSGDALTLYMAALVVADATARGSEPPLNPAALSTYLLDREREGWWQLANSGKITSSPQQIGHVSVVAALTQALPYSAGIQAVQVAGIATSAPEADQLLLDHKITYPTTRPEMVLEALTPDRLAEDYIALTVPGAGPESDFSDPWTISALSHLLTPTQAWRDGSPALPIYIRPAVTGLVEAASRWPHLLTQIIRPLLNRNPGLVLVGGGATVARLATLAGTDANLLKLIDGQLPPRANLEFDEAAVVVAERRIALASNANTSTAEHATLLATVAYRYHNAGRRREALAPAQEAVDIYRVLADPESGNPAVYLPHLAGSLN
ncbi:hypothetical protein SAMN04487914_1231, partial [Arthrobacter sp. ok909]|uniref:ATP-binding protein n=1 Tax=Arthrobacter sp. ok909 TaxID=1761746 RepID=UPI00088FD8B9